MAQGIDGVTNLSAPFKIRTFIVIVTGLIIAIILDISLLRVYDTVSKQFIPTESREFVFAAITVACLVLQYLLLRHIKPSRKPNEKQNESIARHSFQATAAILVALGAAIIFVAMQILVLSYYNVIIILAAILCSYAFCIAILSILISRIASWLGLRKRMLVIFFFVIGLGSIIFNAAVAMADTSLRLLDRPPLTRPMLGASVDVSKGRFDNIDYLYFSSYALSYLTAWIGTATLLHQYSKRIGRAKYVLLLIGPLAFFLMQFVGTFMSFIFPIVSSNQFFLASFITLIISFSKPVGGLMLGIGFWTMARTARKDSPLRFYLIASGVGMLLLFTSNQAILLSIAPYPPFGLSTVSVMGLSSYLVLLGIYSSSVSVSNDDRLRKEIRQKTTAEAKLIEGLISGEKRKEIESKVIQLVKMQALTIQDETGSIPSMTDEEIKLYLEQILQEIKKI